MEDAQEADRGKCEPAKPKAKSTEDDDGDVEKSKGLRATPISKPQNRRKEHTQGVAGWATGGLGDRTGVG